MWSTLFVLVAVKDPIISKLRGILLQCMQHKWIMRYIIFIVISMVFLIKLKCVHFISTKTTPKQKRYVIYISSSRVIFNMHNHMQNHQNANVTATIITVVALQQKRVFLSNVT